MESSVNVSKDGRINVSVHLNEPLPDLPSHYANPIREFAVDHSFTSLVDGTHKGGTVPRMSIVIMIVGSRGESSLITKENLANYSHYLLRGRATLPRVWAEASQRRSPCSDCHSRHI